jgi:CRP/FNR family cyclic AMP-dependent transcriptional regulator
MVKQNIKNILEDNLFFKEFNQEEIEILVKHSVFSSFNEGEFLLGRHQEAKYFYFIINGSVSLQVFSHEHGILELDNIQDGEILGWSWLVPPFAFHYDALALERTNAVYFDAVAIKNEMQKNHDFGFKMYSLFTPIIIERLQASRKNILELYEKSF